jgi:hypothetical protein
VVVKVNTHAIFFYKDYPKYGTIKAAPQFVKEQDISYEQFEQMKNVLTC